MELGRTLVLIGALILVVGLVLTLVGRVPFLGRLPGDISVQGDRWSVYAPIGTMIVVSILLTVALNVFGWLSRR